MLFKHSPLIRDEKDIALISVVVLCAATWCLMGIYSLTPQSGPGLVLALCVWVVLTVINMSASVSLVFSLMLMLNDRCDSA